MIRITNNDNEISVLPAKRILVSDGVVANAYNVEDIKSIEVIPDDLINYLTEKYGV